jgi:hypothetical protein
MRHASVEQLASLAAGELRRRKAARISAHLAHCDHCQQANQQLESVSVLLASVSYAPMPDSLSARIEATIATEARQRVASEPATEAGRGELPARSRRTRQAGRRLPFVSSPMALRMAAATGAAVIVVGGAYELANHGLGSSSGASAPTSASPKAALGTAPAGPQILYLGSNHHQQQVQTVQTKNDFEPGHLQSQVLAAMNQATNSSAGLSGLSNAPAAAGVSGGVAAPSGRPVVGPTLPGQTATDQRMAACIDSVTADQVPEWVDIAKFKGEPAIIIVTSAHGSVPEQVWVVGTGCSASKNDVLDHKVFQHT